MMVINERIFMLVIIALLLQIPISFGIVWAITNYPTLYLGFCLCCVAGVVVWSEWKKRR